MLLVWKRSDIYEDSYVLVLDGVPGSVVFATVVATKEGAVLAFPFKSNYAVAVRDVTEGKVRAEACLKDSRNIDIWGIISEV